MTTVFQKDRIQILDFLRGFSLILIIFMNFFGLLQIPFIESDRDIRHIIDLIFKGKGYSIFSFLFGYGVYIFMNNLEGKGYSPYVFQLKRLLFLFLAGLLHSYLQPSEALKVYAVFGLLLLPVYKVHCRYIFAISFICLIGTTYMAAQYFGTLCMFFLGFGLSKLEIFSRFTDRKYTKEYLSLFIISSILSVIAYYWTYKYITINNGFISKAQFISGLIQSVAYITGIILLYLNSDIFKKIFSHLNYFGRMAFTNYIVQSILLYILNLIHPNTSVVHGIYACIIILIVQLIYSKYYLLHIDNIGPLEKLWRYFTYAKILNSKKDIENK